MRYCPALASLLAAALGLLGCGAAAAAAQQTPPESGADPAAVLADALGAACRLDDAQFASFFTAGNAAAYRALPPDQRRRLLQRFSLADDPGKPLLSSDQDNHTVLRCRTPRIDVEFRFGGARLDGDLAFIPVTVVDSQSAEFGLIRQQGNWKLLSLGLVLLDIRQLSAQWAQGDLAAQEKAAAASLQKISTAIGAYQRTFGKLPDSLAQLGPSANSQASPAQASLLAADLASGASSGYRFRFRVVGADDSAAAQYELEAVPEDYGTSGRASFFRAGDGSLHAADKHGAPASALDPPWHDESQP